MKKKVVITGAGIVSCFGSDVETYYKSLLEGKSGVTDIPYFDVSEYPTRFAAAVQDFSTDGYIEKKTARRIDPAIAYAMVAGKKALENAGVDCDSLDKTRAGIIIGSGMGGMNTFTDGVDTVLNKGFKRLTPFFVPFIITNMPGALLAIDIGFQGPNYSISTACATGTHSIIAAANHIRNGEADLMLCGGSEAAIGPVGLSGFVACKALSTRNEEKEKASRPFDKNRDGFVMGEGCGVLVLESEESAKARGATILAEYCGGYSNCDANHMTNPIEDGSGVAICIERALADAGVKKEDVNHVNAHATATSVGDLCELRAIKKAFGDHAKNVAVNATKSCIGHGLGAAGAFEAIATAFAIAKGEVHPIINCDDPEEEAAGVDLVLGKKRSMEVKKAISNSFGFGGHNAVIVMGKYGA